jgi:two-component system, NarL family, sensor histidine kinase UhpB
MAMLGRMAVRAARVHAVLAALLAATAMLAPPLPAFAAPGAAQADQPFRIDFADPRILPRAELAIVDSATPPGPGAPWQEVALPDLWRAPERYQQGINGWYRFKIKGPAPAEPQSLYLWRYSMNAAVYFNGEWLADGGTFDEPIARNWNRPMLVRLPAAMWRAGENELLLRLRVYPGFGNLLPPALGPTRLLQPDFERRTFLQITMSQVAALAMAIAMLAALLLWAIDRRDRTALYFGALCAAMAVYALNKFVQRTPVDAGTWWWLVHSAVDAANVLMVLFVHRALGVRRPRLEAAMGLLLAVFVGLYALWSLPQLARFNPMLHGVSGLAGAYLFGWLLLRLKRQPSAESAAFTLLVLATVGAGWYDTLLNSRLVPAMWGGGFYVLTLASPVLLLGLVGHLGLRALRAVNAVRQANEGLEARVQQASAEIEATHARERELRGEHAAAQERERIYRDLHDNLGARLLGLVYGATDEPQRTQARGALAEMRTIVASSRLEAGQLADLAQEWRLEAELRCEAAGYALAWHCDGDARLSGRQRYQLKRIVRQLISNALEHAQGKAFDVRWRVHGGRLELRVQDDGRGMPEGAAPRGVLARAADLQGDARWQPAPGGGCVCTVDVALAVPGAPPATLAVEGPQ